MIKGTSEQTLRENILTIVDSIEDCKARTTVLSIINYLIQLYKTASDAGSPNAFGTAIGVGGLITGVAACRVRDIAPKEKYLKLLEFRHFERHVLFSQSDRKEKKKAISNGVNVQVVVKV